MGGKKADFILHMRSIKLKSASYQVYEYLKTLIAGIKKDIALPDEMTLTKSLGVSRRTVRTALKMLSDEHLIQRRPGAGTVIFPNARKKALHSLLVIRMVARQVHAFNYFNIIKYHQIEMYAKLQNFSIEIETILFNSRKNSEQFKQLVKSHRPDALILVGFFQSLIEEVGKITIPYVLKSPYFADDYRSTLQICPRNSVCADYFGFGCSAARDAVSSGAREIYYFMLQSQVECLAGIRQYYADNGLRLGHDNFLCLAGIEECSTTAFFNLTKVLCQKKENALFIVFFDDLIASSFLQGAIFLGIDIGKQFSFVSLYQNNPESHIFQKARNLYTFDHSLFFNACIDRLSYYFKNGHYDSYGHAVPFLLRNDSL